MQTRKSLAGIRRVRSLGRFKGSTTLPKEQNENREVAKSSNILRELKKPLPEKAATPSQIKTMKKSKSTSNLNAGGKGASIKSKPRKPRQSNIRRIARGHDELTIDQLAQRIDQYTMLDKRDPQELSPNIYEGHRLNFQTSPSITKKSKRNTKINKMVEFESSRLKTMIRCVKEDECMQMDDKLKNVFHKGIMNEDNDTDDSEQHRGVLRNYNNLKKALKTYQLRRTSRRMMPNNKDESQDSKAHRKLATMNNSEIQNDNISKPHKNLKKGSLKEMKETEDLTSVDQSSPNQTRENSKNIKKNGMEEEKTKAKDTDIGKTKLMAQENTLRRSNSGKKDDSGKKIKTN